MGLSYVEYAKELMKEVLEEMDGVIIGGEGITVTKYAGDQVVLATSEQDVQKI